MCKLGDSGLIIVRYFTEIFVRYMPLCVLLANVYFKLFNGRHYKPMQSQLKLASCGFLLHFEKTEVAGRFHRAFV